MKKRYGTIALCLVVALTVTLIPANVFGTNKIHSVKEIKKEEPKKIKKTRKYLDNIEDFTIKRTEEMSVLLEWSKVKDADGYYIYRKNKVKEPYKILTKINKSSINQFFDKNVREGRTYYYNIRAYKKEKTKKIYSKYGNRMRATFRFEEPKFSLEMPLKFNENNTLSVVIKNHENSRPIYIYGTIDEEEVASIIPGGIEEESRMIKLKLLEIADLTEMKSYEVGDEKLQIAPGHRVKAIYGLVDPQVSSKYEKDNDSFIFFIKYRYNDYAVKWSKTQGKYEEKV